MACNAAKCSNTELKVGNKARIELPKSDELSNVMDLLRDRPRLLEDVLCPSREITSRSNVDAHKLKAFRENLSLL